MAALGGMLECGEALLSVSTGSFCEGVNGCNRCFNNYPNNPYKTVGLLSLPAYDFYEELDQSRRVNGKKCWVAGFLIANPLAENHHAGGTGPREPRESRLVQTALFSLTCQKQCN